MNLSQLKSLGFDKSYHVPFTKTYKIGCSQCQAVAINGLPCHETGCINAQKEKDDDKEWFIEYDADTCPGRPCSTECDHKSYGR